MSVTPLRPPAPEAFGRPRSLRSPDVLLAQISALVAARQSLRARGAPADALERNRVQIARAQWDLSHALVARYCAPAAAA